MAGKKNVGDMSKFEFLNDISERGKKRDWKGKKEASQKLSASYGRLSVHFEKQEDLEKKYFNKMLKVDNCGSYLEFKRLHDDRLKLQRAFFCKDRLCPLCAWRRSLKVYGMVSAVTGKILEKKNYSFLLLTFTLRNCWGPDLSREIDHLLQGYSLFRRVRKVERSFLGMFRSLEVTRNWQKFNEDGSLNEWYLSYHPHIHVLVCVDSDKYFSDSYYYVEQAELVEMWQSCCDVDYLPSVDIREIKGGRREIEKAVAEVAKYTLKSKDVVPEDVPLVDDVKDSRDLEAEFDMDENIFTLSEALFNRRLVSFSGIFGKVKRQIFGNEDAVDGDLVHVEDDSLSDEEEAAVVKYYWNRGVSDYCLMA